MHRESIEEYLQELLLHNCPLKGIGVRDFYDFFDVFWGPGGFPLDADRNFEQKLRI